LVVTQPFTLEVQVRTLPTLLMKRVAEAMLVAGIAFFIVLVIGGAAMARWKYERSIREGSHPCHCNDR
jgi:hypothetical protein